MKLPNIKGVGNSFYTHLHYNQASFQNRTMMILKKKDIIYVCIFTVHSVVIVIFNVSNLTIFCTNQVEEEVKTSSYNSIAIKENGDHF